MHLVATRRLLADDYRVVALGFPVLGFDDGRLAAVAVANPSERVADAVATASVAEAAALLAVGGSAVLALPKQRSAHVTVAIARGS